MGTLGGSANSLGEDLHKALHLTMWCAHNLTLKQKSKAFNIFIKNASRMDSHASLDLRVLRRITCMVWLSINKNCCWLNPHVPHACAHTKEIIFASVRTNSSFVFLYQKKLKNEFVCRGFVIWGLIWGMLTSSKRRFCIIDVETFLSDTHAELIQ